MFKENTLVDSDGSKKFSFSNVQISYMCIHIEIDPVVPTLGMWNPKFFQHCII